MSKKSFADLLIDHLASEFGSPGITKLSRVVAIGNRNQAVAGIKKSLVAYGKKLAISELDLYQELSNGADASGGFEHDGFFVWGDPLSFRPAERFRFLFSSGSIQNVRLRNSETDIIVSKTNPPIKKWNIVALSLPKEAGVYYLDFDQGDLRYSLKLQVS